MHTRHPLVPHPRGPRLARLQRRWTWFRGVLVAHYEGTSSLPERLDPARAATAGSLDAEFDPDFDDPMLAPFRSTTFEFRFGAFTVSAQDWVDSQYSSHQSIRLRAADVAEHVSLQLGSLFYLELDDAHRVHDEWLAALEEFEGGRDE